MSWFWPSASPEFGPLISTKVFFKKLCKFSKFFGNLLIELSNKELLALLLIRSVMENRREKLLTVCVSVCVF